MNKQLVLIMIKSGALLTPFQRDATEKVMEKRARQIHGVIVLNDHGEFSAK